MAQELAIAKAGLSASLFRSDPTPLSRPSVDEFLSQLSSTLTTCSRPNVQKCRTWVTENISPSPSRIASLARYLSALSRSIDTTAATTASSSSSSSSSTKPSPRRQRLHVLYIINDVAHHDRNLFAQPAWETHLPNLVSSAASFENCPRHMAKLQSLLDLWQQRDYFPPGLQLREAMTSAPATTTTMTTTTTTTTTTPIVTSSASASKSTPTPFVLPSLHGDPTTPWYDLPASTWLPHIQPNSTRPMDPDSIRPIPMHSGPADPKLTAAVTTLLSDVARLFSKERGDEAQHDDQDLVVHDVSELGEDISVDVVTGHVVDGETYYGWSRSFCQQMKQRGRKRSRSRSRSRTPPHQTQRERRSPSSSYSASPPASPPPRHQFNHPPAPPPAFPPPADFPIPPPPPVGYNGPWPPPPPPPVMGSNNQTWFPPPPPPPPIHGAPWGLLAPPPPPPPPHQYQGGGGNHRGNFRGRGRW